MESLSLSFLPDDPLLNVLSYLNYADLTRCCMTCHRLRVLSAFNPLWRRQCRVYWLVERCSEDQSWRDCFITWFHSYGQYVDIYRLVRLAWDQIEAFSEKYCPAIFQSLEDGVSECEIASYESYMKQKLPLDVRCSYRLHAGQKLGSETNSPGLLGSVEYAGVVFTEYLLPPFYTVDVYGERYVALSLNYTLHQYQVLALNDHIGFEPGQVFYFKGNEFSENSVSGEFIAANSYLEWFTTYAQQVADGVYPVIEENIYRFFKEPGTEAVTGSLTVSVATAFISSQSHIDPPHFAHAYRITISMDPDASELDSCQLESRSWIIIDEDGKEEKVSGPGVVGQFPVMKPGVDFSWISSTYFRTTYGSMKGHFVMRSLQSGALFEAVCPTFTMKCLPYQTVVDRRERVLLSKKNR